MNTSPTALYRHFNAAGELLYVGISLSAINRLSQHKSSGWSGEIIKVEIEHFESRMLAKDAEEKAIKLEKPKYNKAHNIYDYEMEPIIDENGHAAVYFCSLSPHDCDVSNFFGSTKFIKKPPRCPKCGSKSSFESVMDERGNDIINYKKAKPGTVFCIGPEGLREPILDVLKRIKKKAEAQIKANENKRIKKQTVR